MNPYEVLGVSPSSSEAAIKKAYRKLAAKHHPDRGGNEEKFKEINEAYSMVSSGKKRQEFQNRQTGPSDFGDIFGNFGSIFEDMFGGRRRANHPRPQTDDELIFDLKISLSQIKAGLTQRFSYKRNKKCPTCNGIGGASRKTCDHCGGTGTKVIKTGRMIQQAVCRACFGNGVVIKDPCGTCSGTGVIQVVERININIKEL